MAFYRMGMRVQMTRAVTRAMKRSGNKQSATTIQKMLNARSKLGGSIARPIAASLAEAIDTGVVFHTAEYLFFDDGEDDDGT
ncbi:TPA: hypothetical protein N0F65_009274 [Lagenidium giganteum]|uniref:Uncharacterized protein n=1 Tax=Lagenidium giganteum TaxID=4803 RepID=A0AAV2YQB5_9STRA|nr:TPA: hypothetical protein N0F65_009274 [Lagenidium giganteum]